MALPQPNNYMTEAEYLAFDDESDVKHEYIQGEIYAMTGASGNHNAICAYTMSALIQRLGDKPCTVYASDLRVNAAGLYTYPDVSVVCGESQFAEGVFDTLVNPTVLIEVLSPSTERNDRGIKLHHYRQIPTLQTYLLIAQDMAQIERYERQDTDNWLYTVVSGLDGVLDLSSIGCTLPLADVYRKINFETE